MAFILGHKSCVPCSDYFEDTPRQKCQIYYVLHIKSLLLFTSSSPSTIETETISATLALNNLEIIR